MMKPKKLKKIEFTVDKNISKTEILKIDEYCFDVYSWTESEVKDLL